MIFITLTDSAKRPLLVNIQDISVVGPTENGGAATKVLLSCGREIIVLESLDEVRKLCEQA